MIVALLWLSGWAVLSVIAALGFGWLIRRFPSEVIS